MAVSRNWQWNQPFLKSLGEAWNEKTALHDKEILQLCTAWDRETWQTSTAHDKIWQRRRVNNYRTILFIPRHVVTSTWAILENVRWLLLRIFFTYGRAPFPRFLFPDERGNWRLSSCGLHSMHISPPYNISILSPYTVNTILRALVVWSGLTACLSPLGTLFRFLQWPLIFVGEKK